MPGREPFFSGNWGSKLLFRARSDKLELNGRKRGQGGRDGARGVVGRVTGWSKL